MRLSAWLAPLALVLSLPYCGGSVGSGSPGSDAGAPPVDSGAPGTVVGDCAADGSCPSGSTCYFAIGSCDAKGQCVTDPAPGAPECGAVELLCGCGQEATSGCGSPDGFASAPALSGASCGVTPVDDASTPTDGGPTVDGSAPGGPCESNDDCSPGYGCYYAIGSCPGQGECVANPSGPGCSAEESFCGCDGSQVTSGCGFPRGYASGPTDGSASCTTLDAGSPDAAPPDAGDDVGDSCGPLGSCCPTLPSGSQASCSTVASSDDETACASQLAALEADGYCD